MSNNSQGYRATALCRPTVSIGHNLRLAEYIEKQKKEHIDLSRPHKAILHLGDEKEVYEKIFGESIKKYNAKQKRKDRRITDYLKQVIEDKRKGKHKSIKASSDRKPMYEFQFYLGNRESHCPDEIAEKVLVAFVTKILPKKFPNFVCTTIALHNDEYSFDRKGNRFESPLHLHVDGVFVAHALTDEELKEEKEFRKKCKELKKLEFEKQGIEWDEEKWKQKDWRKGMIARYGKSLEKGMELQTSMSAACAEMGFFTEKEKGTAQQQFEEAIRHELMDFAESMGIKINRTKGYKHSHVDKDIYVQEKENAEREQELNEKEEVLKAKEILLQNQIDDFDYKIEHLEELEKQNADKKNELDEKEKILNQEIEEVKKQKNENYELKQKLNYKQDCLNKEEIKIVEKTELLKFKENKIIQKEIELDKREEKVLQGEQPLIERENKIIKKENELNLRTENILSNEEKIKKQKEELSKKENALSIKDKYVNEKLQQSIENKNQTESNLKNIQELYLQNEKMILNFNVESKTKIEKINSWERAYEEIENTDSWVTNEFKLYSENKHKENAFSKFCEKIKNGFRNIIIKMKNFYEEKISNLQDCLFGTKRFFKKGNNAFVEYTYGSEDYKKMLLETPINKIEQAINVCKQNKKNTFGDLINNEDFFIKHFDRARELSEERKKELEIYKKRTQGLSR